MSTRCDDLITGRVNSRAGRNAKSSSITDTADQLNASLLNADLPKVWSIDRLVLWLRPVKNPMHWARLKQASLKCVYVNAAIVKYCINELRWSREQQELAVGTGSGESVAHERHNLCIVSIIIFQKSSQTCQNKQTERSTFVFNNHLHFVCV